MVDQQDMRRDAELNREILVLAIFITLICGFLFMGICFKGYKNLESTWYVRGLEKPPNYWTEVIIPTVLYTVLHPVIGRMWVAIVKRLCIWIDYTYFDGYEVWSGYFSKKNFTVLFASLWPITGTVGFIITFIGVVFGVLFRKLF